MTFLKRERHGRLGMTGKAPERMKCCQVAPAAGYCPSDTLSVSESPLKNANVHCLIRVSLGTCSNSHTASCVTPLQDVSLTNFIHGWGEAMTGSDLARILISINARFKDVEDKQVGQKWEGKKAAFLCRQ